MLIRLIAKNKLERALDYQLVDFLRALSAYDRISVIGRLWVVRELDLWSYDRGAYGADALRLMFPELNSPAAVMLQV